MRRFYKGLIALLMICMLAGCGKKSNKQETDKELFVIGFSQVGAESDWRLANTRSMQETFTNERGYELLMENAMQQQDNQFAAVRRFILEDVDLIVIAPTTEEGWDILLEEVHEAGIPVIIMDRSVAVWNRDLYLTNIGSNFLEQGEEAISWIETNLPVAEDEPLKVLHLKGTDGSTAQLMRTRALEEADQRHEDWTIVQQLNGDFTEAKGYEVMTNYLKHSQDFDVIYSENDNMTFGAMRALDEAGITYGENGKVKIVTFDATKRALQLCLEGKINLCVECNPLHGPLVEELIQKYRNGEQIQETVYISESVFTKENLTQEFIDQRTY
ncbi:MAG: ABC transporter substrate-binding protein [Clostridiales bacterium]|nr:ABC transporter substrate-binding protein [Candidatus Scatonaster coprocaballi]